MQKSSAAVRCAASESPLNRCGEDEGRCPVTGVQSRHSGHSTAGDHLLALPHGEGSRYTKGRVNQAREGALVGYRRQASRRRLRRVTTPNERTAPCLSQSTKSGGQ